MTRLPLRGLVAALALALLAPGAARAAEKTIRIGFLFGLSGNASVIGPVQLDGAKLAVDEVNKAGGIRWGNGKAKVEYVVKDDETKPDIAIRRFRELLDENKVDVVVGQTFAPISAALNKQVKQSPIAYFPVNVVALSMFRKEEMAPSTFAVHGCAYSAGYAGATYVVKNLGARKVVFFGPAYAFGQDQWRGAKAAFDRLGMKVEYVESPVGTADFTPYLTRIAEAKPDVVMLAHWGTDAINVLKQTYETGLKGKTRIWFDWMTNVFGSGVPAEAMDGVYGLMSWYYDLGGFQDKDVAARAKSFTEKFAAAYKYPPDPYSVMAYTGTKEALRAIELAQSTEPAKVAAALTKAPEFESLKGKATWRQDRQPSFKYNAFVVVGKGAKDRKDPKWDLVKVVGAYSGEDYLPPLKDLGY